MSDTDLRRFAKNLAYEFTVNTAYHLFKKNDSNTLEKESYKKPKRKKRKKKTSSGRNLETVLLPKTFKSKD